MYQWITWNSSWKLFYFWILVSTQLILSNSMKRKIFSGDGSAAWVGTRKRKSHQRGHRSGHRLFRAPFITFFMAYIVQTNCPVKITIFGISVPTVGSFQILKTRGSKASFLCLYVRPSVFYRGGNWFN